MYSQNQRLVEIIFVLNFWYVYFLSDIYKIFLTVRITKFVVSLSNLHTILIFIYLNCSTLYNMMAQSDKKDKTCKSI